MSGNGWKGGALRVALDSEEQARLACELARLYGLAYAIDHQRGDGETLLVASVDPAGSGLPVVARREVGHG